MKTIDLMIGDWVLKYNNCPVRVTSLSILGGDVIGVLEVFSSREYRYSNVEPIPLTEEILRANNIPHQQSLLHGVEWVRNLGDKGFEITLDTHDFAINANIKYVHQLQHALRLVGLDEVADIFKLK